MHRIEASDGNVLEIYPIGTRVRHKEYPELVGEIVGHEYHESGKISPLPYLVHWDNNTLAHDKLGIFFVYPSPKSIEEA